MRIMDKRNVICLVGTMYRAFLCIKLFDGVIICCSARSHHYDSSLIPCFNYINKQQNSWLFLSTFNSIPESMLFQLEMVSGEFDS